MQILKKIKAAKNKIAKKSGCYLAKKAIDQDPEAFFKFIGAVLTKAITSEEGLRTIGTVGLAGHQHAKKETEQNKVPPKTSSPKPVKTNFPSFNKEELSQSIKDTFKQDIGPLTSFFGKAVFSGLTTETGLKVTGNISLLTYQHIQKNNPKKPK